MDNNRISYILDEIKKLKNDNDLWITFIKNWFVFSNLEINLIYKAIIIKKFNLMNLYSIDFGGRTMFMTRIVDGKYISVKAPNGKEQFTNAI